MNYIYTLSNNGIPFYVGSTSDPIRRYVNHVFCSWGVNIFDAITPMLKNKIYPVLNIVEHCEDDTECLFLEKKTILHFAETGIKLVNKNYNPPFNRIILSSLDYTQRFDGEHPKGFSLQAKNCFNEYINIHKIVN